MENTLLWSQANYYHLPEIVTLLSSVLQIVKNLVALTKLSQEQQDENSELSLTFIMKKAVKISNQATTEF